jgi:Heat induced stress protein YflT
MIDDRVVVGVFADQEQARQALHELYRAGFPAEHIGFLVRDEAMLAQGTTTEMLAGETEREPIARAVTGGVLGGVIGAAVALLIPGLGPALAGGILTTVGGAALGAATGGLMAVLTQVGVPEEEARSYDEAFQAGRTIVIVQAEQRLAEAYAILKRNYSSRLDTGSEMVGADEGATVKLEPS